MRAVLPRSHPSVSKSDPVVLGDLPDPRPAAGEALIDVAATALNHADLLQMRGAYPVPPGESEVPGLECAGTVAEVGEGVTEWVEGDRVMALLAGGGHATKVAAPAGQVMPLPESWSFEEGAALPEAALTAWTNLVAEGELEAGRTVLITGANGAMGSMMVQVAHHLGARVLAAGRDEERLRPLLDLGAEVLVLLGDDLPEAVREHTDGDGADLVVELVGGEHLSRSLGALKKQGRLVLVGLLAGVQAEIDLGDVLRRRLHLVGSVLRARSRDEKARLVSGFRDRLGDVVEAGKIDPRVGPVFPLEDIADAYRALKDGGQDGKVVVRVG
jgi:putative PIG3 family NAD(P)H quinone oxidoreductase